VIKWAGLNGEEKQQLMPILSTTDNWILLTHQLGESNETLPPFREAKLVAKAEGENSRHKGWWRERKDELATNSITTEVWRSTKGRIPEATRTTIQEAIEVENSKDTPSFGTEDLETIYRRGTEAGLSGIYSFPGAVYATDGSNDKGVMGAGFYRLDKNRGGCCQLGRGEEGNSSNRAELGASSLALEDAKDRKVRNPMILLSDSASPPKWRKCESFRDNGLRGRRQERAMDRMDRPRTSIDERMLSGRRTVVIVWWAVVGFWSFFIDFLLLVAATFCILGLDFCVLAYWGSAALLLPL